jgi:hypothetical protein
MEALHPEFIKYCEDNGINLEHSDDYDAWWDCWSRGYGVGTRETTDRIDKIIREA